MKQMNIEKKHILKNSLNYLSLLLYSFSVDYFLNDSIGIYSIVFFFMFVIVLSFSKRLFYISVVISGILTAIYIPVMLQYGTPSFSMSVALFYTHEKEALSFITKFPLEYYLFSFLFIVFTFIVATRNYNPIRGGLRLTTISITILFALIYPAYMFTFKSEEIKGYSSIIHYGPIKFITKNIKFLYEVKQENDIMKSVLTKKDSWQIDREKIEKDMHIVVIGESVRRDFMHTYGFKIKNTPFMSSSNGVKFENFHSAGSSTIPSLQRMLCQNDRRSYNIENNLVTLAKKAGLQTYWLSNQGYIGKWDTPISGIARFSNVDRFLHAADYNSIKTKDEQLLPWINEAIADTLENNQLIVIHLAGSHHPFCQKTDGIYDEFFITEEISCYVKSIKNTDKLLEDIYRAAIASKKSFNMVYFSDHGLNFTGKHELVHGGEHKENYDVPLFIWSDDAVSLDTISAARSGMDFLTLFAELVGIKEKSLERNYKFISNDIAPEIIIFNHNNELKSYNDLKDDKFDFNIEIIHNEATN